MPLIKVPNRKSIILLLFLLFGHNSFSKKTSDFLGAVSLQLKGGSVDAPYHKVVSPSLKGKPVFRGQVESAHDNNITFYRVPDLLDPTILANPFKVGSFSTTKARAVAVLNESNHTIDRINLLDGGSGYLEPPDVFVQFPAHTASYNGELQNAFASAELNSSDGSISAIEITNPGKGYSIIPEIEIEGGTHFVRIIDEDSNHSGKFYRVLSNSGVSLTVENKLNENIPDIFAPDSEVEIFESWTLGELFGYSSTSLQDVNQSNGLVTGDYLYLLSESSQQSGTLNDFEGFFHDQTSWKRLDNSAQNSNHVVVYPNQSIVIARRSPSDLNLILNGTALTESTFIDIPLSGKRLLLSNPYAVDLMLSDLVDSQFITDDNQTSFLWFANDNQEIADNVKILKDGVWSTFWHDGSNRNITEKAFASARAGSGPGASLLQRDISFSEGEITAMSNPVFGDGIDIEVYSDNHGLRNGFIVRIVGAEGYKTNDQKQLINEFGDVVDNNDSALVIMSGANGYYTIHDVTTNSFKLTGKAGDCNFIYNGNAKWVTGSRGEGYDKDCYVSFIGGGGSGAYGVAKVNNGRVESISISESGSGYIEAPKIVIHSGGWRKLGAGNAPFNDVLIPSGSGILIVRNHPNGQASSFPVVSPFK